MLMYISWRRTLENTSFCDFPLRVDNGKLVLHRNSCTAMAVLVDSREGRAAKALAVAPEKPTEISIGLLLGPLQPGEIPIFRRQPTLRTFQSGTAPLHCYAPQRERRQVAEVHPRRWHTGQRIDQRAVEYAFRAG